MKVFNVDLKKEYGFLQGGTLDCLVTEYPYDGEQPDSWALPALIVIPGGGYGMTSKREGFPIATAFMAKGFQTFIVNYLCQPQGARYPEQLLEEAAAVDYVKKHAKALHINPNEVFLVGFSAGGHLVGNLAVEHQNVAQKAGVALDCKPTAVGLCYPVITHVGGHFVSYENLLSGYSEEAKEELFKTLDLNEAVSAQTPPAFIWATASDNVVPADNALRYALAMAKNNLDYEIHIYPEGAHGLSTGHRNINLQLSDEAARTARWVDDCACFFRRYTMEKF